MNKRLFSLLGLLAALTLAACGAKPASTPQPADAADAASPTVLTADARLVPQDYADISFQLSGQVRKILVTEGDSVTAGQGIAQLDDQSQQQALSKADLAVQEAQVNVNNAQHGVEMLVGWSPNKSQLNGAQANLANAEAAVKVAQSAYDKVAFNPSVSASPQSLALEQATNNYNKAKADLDYLYSFRPDITAANNALQGAKLALSSAQLDLENAKSALDKTVLHAPFGGVVTRLNLRAGEAVAAGQPVATVADLNTWIVETDNLTELEVTQVKAGQKVAITFDALPDKTFHGEVKRIASQFEEKRGDITYTVTITLTDSDPDLRWGMTASVQFSQ